MSAARIRYVGDFDTFGVCECGYFERIPFGLRVHIHKSVCPGCGRSTGAWEKVVGRPARVGGGFFGGGKTVIVPKDAA